MDSDKLIRAAKMVVLVFAPLNVVAAWGLGAHPAYAVIITFVSVVSVLVATEYITVWEHQLTKKRARAAAGAPDPAQVYAEVLREKTYTGIEREHLSRGEWDDLVAEINGKALGNIKTCVWCGQNLEYIITLGAVDIYMCDNNACDLARIAVCREPETNEGGNNEEKPDG